MHDDERHLRDLIESAPSVEEMRAAEQLLDEYIERVSKESRFVVATLRDVASFFGVAEQTVRQWGMRPGGIPGTAGRWPLDEIARWLTRWREAPTVSEPKPMEDVKRKLAELDLAEREKRLVDVGEIQVLMGRTAAVLRDGITALEQRHGTEAADVMRTPLERLRKEWETDAAK